MEKIIQITSGKGPEECERAVALIWKKMQKEAAKAGLKTEALDLVEGRQAGTFLSVLFKLSGDSADAFVKEWEGTIQWIAQSPYRKFHKRKNWFAGVVAHDVPQAVAWNDNDVAFQTLKASGPGGQHVNKVESAVRATHIPTGISVTASTERSQAMNKKEAVERLKGKLLSIQLEKANEKVQDQWMEHNTLERGNAVKIFKEPLT